MTDGRRSGRRTLSALVGAALLASSLAGCSAAEDIASQAGEGARSAAEDAAREEALQLVCGVVEDGRVNDTDLERLRAAVRAAEAAGVEGEVLDTADRLLGEEGGVPDGAVEELQASCAQAGPSEAP